MPKSFEMKPLKDWKGATPTFGVIAALGSLLCIVFIAGLTISGRGKAEVKEVVKETLTQHCEKQIKKAHPDIYETFTPTVMLEKQLSHFVPRTEVQKRLDAVVTSVEKLATEQRQVLRSIRVRRIR